MTGNTKAKILEGISKPSYNKYTCPFPGCLAEVLKYLNDPISYDFLMAVSGAAFRRAWKQGDGGNVDLMYYSPFVEEHTFKAVGWTYSTIPFGNRALIAEAIKESINRNVPAFCFGIIGPPECGIIAGYEENGEIMVGYSFFQDHKVQGYYHESDWYKDNLQMVVILKDKIAKSSERDTLRVTLQFALSLGIDPLLDKTGHHSGIAACLAYADALEDNSFFPNDDEEKMNTQAMLFWDQSAMLYERRHASLYLRKVTGVPMNIRECLDSAAEKYEQVYKETEWIQELGGQLAMRKIKPIDSKLGSVAGRKEISDAYRAVCQKEREALESIEEALRGLPE